MKPFLSFEVEESAWLAGFVDGDGCITYKRNAKYPNLVYPRLELYQSGYEGWKLLTWICERIGAGGVYDGSNTSSHHKLPAYVFIVEGMRARQVIQDIEPFLKLKGARAREVLENSK